MHAILLQSGSPTFRDDLPPPVPAENEVLVKVTRAGICETDLQLAQGYMGFDGILGHEFVGVAQSGPFAGQRVVGEINCNCRSCPRCKAGLGNHCDRRTVIGIDRHDGAFAEIVAVSQANLHEVPQHVSDDQAVFVEPLAAAFQILDQVSVKQSDRVLILGDGRLALMSGQALKLTGATLTVIGKHQHKLSRFDEVDAQTVLLEKEMTLSENLPEASFDVVVDCTGSPSGLPMAIRFVRPRGCIVMKTTVAADHQLSLAPIVINEINLVGSRCGPFAKAIQALSDKQVNLNGLITHRFPLESAAEAMRCAANADAFKVVFDIS